MDQPIPDGASSSKFNVREFLIRATVGLIFAALLAAPAMFWALMHYNVSHLQTVVVYVAVALVSGIAFSVATISEGRLQWGKLGISLGGGAAIGIITIVIVHRLLPPTPAPVLLTPTTGATAVLVNNSPTLRVSKLEGVQEWVVEVLRPSDASDGASVSFIVDSQSPVTYLISNDGRARLKSDAETK